MRTLLSKQVHLQSSFWTIVPRFNLSLDCPCEYYECYKFQNVVSRNRTIVSCWNSANNILRCPSCQNKTINLNRIRFIKNPPLNARGEASLSYVFFGHLLWLLNTKQKLRGPDGEMYKFDAGLRERLFIKPLGPTSAWFATLIQGPFALGSAFNRRGWIEVKLHSSFLFPFWQPTTSPVPIIEGDFFDEWMDPSYEQPSEHFQLGAHWSTHGLIDWSLIGVVCPTIWLIQYHYSTKEHTHTRCPPREGPLIIRPSIKA